MEGEADSAEIEQNKYVGSDVSFDVWKHTMDPNNQWLKAETVDRVIVRV